MIAHQLLHYLNQSPTPHHAALGLLNNLKATGFQCLDELEAWQLKPGGRYCFLRNGTTLVAFVVGLNDVHETGIRMIGAHTDSPCLKVKPNPDIYSAQCWQLGVEVYGGLLFNPLFDRDLGLAGQVLIRDGDGCVQSMLFDSKQPVGVVPSLAIHLDRDANTQRTVNAQLHLPVVMAMLDPKGERPTLKQWLRDQLQAQTSSLTIEEVLDFDLCFYDTQPGAIVGVNGDYITSSRLDNLLSCYTATQALIAAGNQHSALLVCHDHEEVGSQSAVGAQSDLVPSVLRRWCGAGESFTRVMRRSLLLSVDNAHALHPNYLHCYDAQHGPIMHQGVVIKSNANQRYASSASTQAFFRQLCATHRIPVQHFVVRSDMGCGSTIGPMSAAALGVDTLDIGVPTFAMHSIRETAGTQDVEYLRHALTVFLQGNS